MNFIKGQAPHFQISSGHYWIVPPLTPLPPGGTEIPDWDQAYQEVLVELFSGPAYHAATVTPIRCMRSPSTALASKSTRPPMRSLISTPRRWGRRLSLPIAAT